MSLNHINPEQLADLWTRRVTGRMTLTGISPEEVQETTDILKSFIKTGVEMLIQEPEILIPRESLENLQPAGGDAKVLEIFQQPEPVPLDAEKLNKLIELFIRSVNQMSKQLRDRGTSWDDRRYILEQASWETFNMAKLLIGLYYTPDSKMRAMDTNEMLLTEMVKQGTNEILGRYLEAAKNPSMSSEGG